MTILGELDRALGGSAIVYYGSEEPSKPIETVDVYPFYKALKSLENPETVALVISAEGGMVTAARRIALMARESAKRLVAYIPYRVHSAAVLLCLVADEIVMGDMGELSPLNPSLISDGGENKGMPQQLAAADIEAFAEMARNWFGSGSSKEALRLLTCQIFPPSIAALYRAKSYMRDVAEKLIEYQLPRSNRKERLKIIDCLMDGHREHHHGFVLSELLELGLCIRGASREEDELLARTYEGCKDSVRIHRERRGGNDAGVAGIIATSKFSANYVAPVDEPQAVRFSIKYASEGKSERRAGRGGWLESGWRRELLLCNSRYMGNGRSAARDMGR